MPRRSGVFRRAGQFDLSQTTTGSMPLLKNFIHQWSLLAGIPIESMPDWIGQQAELAVREIKRDVGIDSLSPTAASAPKAAAAPKPVEQPEEESESGSKRSTGAKQAWETRRLVNQYMDEHEGVSRDEALQAVLATIPGRLRVVDPDAPLTRGQKAFRTRVERVMREAEERGEPISREEAQKLVSHKMRGDRSSGIQKDAA